MAPLLMPQLFDDRNVEPLSKIADAVHEQGCKLAIQLWHAGVRGFPTFKQESTYDLDATWYTVSPSQVPLGEFPGTSTPKELSGQEIEEILDAFASAATRAIRAGLDGVELHKLNGLISSQRAAGFETFDAGFSTWQEVLAVAQELDPRFSAIPIVAAGTGLRPQEWIALERGDIERGEGSVVRVRRTFQGRCSEAVRKDREVIETRSPPEDRCGGNGRHADAR